jgi:hypothetical protein
MIMSEPIKPGDFQRRIIRLVNYEDGLWDITLGLIFMALGVFPLTRQLLGPSLNFIFYLLYLAIIVVIQQYARRIISTPRIGVVRNLRSKARMIVMVVLIGLVLLTLALVITTFISNNAQQQPNEAVVTQRETDYRVDVIAGLAVIGVFSLMGFAFGIRRLHLYGVLIGVGNLASTIFRYEYGFPFNLPLVIAAGMIIFMGAILLLRFLRKYPIPNNGTTNANR